MPGRRHGRGHSHPRTQAAQRQARPATALVGQSRRPGVSINPPRSGLELAPKFIRDGLLTVMEEGLVREGLAFATVGVYNRDVKPKPTDAATSGFTEFDLATLNEFSAAQLAERRWSRAHVVHGPFADFLAAWHADAANAAAPHLTIARFNRTGTKPLTVGALAATTEAPHDRTVPAPARSQREPAPAARCRTGS